MHDSWKTREVAVGSLLVGGDQPIRIQSMTTSPTDDVAATVDQIVRLANAGCEIVRVTVQGMKEARACEKIKDTLVQKGYTIPLVADIHFYPPAAMCVADFVDKIRINPGNFADKRASFKPAEYDAASYAHELNRLQEKLVPLVEKCKRLKRALRIGTNHGSLSDRIMNRYGDSPAGMVESALEFAQICRACDYHDMIFSMKSSNPKVMIAAYRLLVQEMMQRGWDYPLHLGVTEAGEGEDGRIKSAMGIGALLLDGIGDTIRVSLTEDPWHEIDPCRRLTRLIPRQPFLGRWPKERQRLPLKEGDNAIVVDLPEKDRVQFARQFFASQSMEVPTLLRFSYTESNEDLILRAAAECGAILSDGWGDDIEIQGLYDADFLSALRLNILQAARIKMSKTDFISCPSCGRTLFDLQLVSARIRRRTAHLPGVKIAIMGCIVNGPGEMADADFGYVGSKPGMIDLYVGKQCVQKNIPSEEADQRLVDLIKEHGLWIEP